MCVHVLNAFAPMAVSPSFYNRACSDDDVTYLLTIVPHPLGHWQLQELFGNQKVLEKGLEPSTFTLGK